MRRSKSLSGLVGLLLLGAGIGQVWGQGTKPTAKWAPDPATAKQLGPAVAVEQYSLRVPKGYEAQQTPPNVPAGMRLWGWAPAPRDDGTRPSLTLNLLTLPDAQKQRINSLSLEQLADRLVGGVKRQRVNWKQEKTEAGVINGINFARIRWEGTDPARNLNTRGLMYVARDGENIIQIAVQDLASEAAKSLPLAEASALTFKKK